MKHKKKKADKTGKSEKLIKRTNWKARQTKTRSMENGKTENRTTEQH